MSLHDDKTNFKVVVSIAPAVIATTTATGAAVDTDGFSGVTAVVTPGAITDGTFTPKLQECATSGGSFTDVAAGDLIGAFVACVASTVQRVGYTGSLRYVKVVDTVTGSPSTGGYVPAFIVLSNPRQLPVT